MSLCRFGAGVATVVAALIVTAAPAGTAAQAGGRLAGTVTLTVARGARSPATAYESRSVAPRAKPQSELRNVVIFFSGVPASSPGRTPATIAQKDEQFVPHVVAITTGSAVDFPNQDPFFHNVFSLSRGATFDLGRYPPGSTRAQVFRQPGIVKVFCHIHSQMSAVIRVFDHGWFTIPDEKGAFTLDEVPPGDHTVVAWHERIGERRDRVSIRPGQTTRLNFTLPVLEPAP
jgi:plastocyanin